MTKQWDVYEATIKDLYAENTLSVVRQIMIEQYGFKASVRAYRGRLIRWGVRKYNCRKRSGSSSSRGSAGSANEAGFSSGSDTSSPTMTAAVATATSALSHSAGAGVDAARRIGAGHLAMPGQPYAGHQAQIYNADNYETKPKVLLSPPLSQSSQSSSSANMQYAWDASSPPLAPAKKIGSMSAPDLHGYGSSHVSNVSNVGNVGNVSMSSGGGGSGHHAEVMAPPSYFGGYGGGPVPMNNNPYASPPSANYEEVPANSHRGSGSGGSGGRSLSYYGAQQRGREGGQMQDGLPYPSVVRDYGHGG
ncbi:hypothetical protein F5Y13DRAFT_191660 [Hypoxylon sp. FL1857]|nr:hypothetical protein F5Y13DRAFT_191660 [Hypoxylon sp. FL1857]